MFYAEYAVLTMKAEFKVVFTNHLYLILHLRKMGKVIGASSPNHLFVDYQSESGVPLDSLNKVLRDSSEETAARFLIRPEYGADITVLVTRSYKAEWDDPTPPSYVAK